VGIKAIELRLNANYLCAVILGFLFWKIETVSSGPFTEAQEKSFALSLTIKVIGLLWEVSLNTLPATIDIVNEIPSRERVDLDILALNNEHRFSLIVDLDENRPGLRQSIAHCGSMLPNLLVGKTCPSHDGNDIIGAQIQNAAAAAFGDNLNPLSSPEGAAARSECQKQQQ
jgi:hypothetical protein